MGRVAVLSAYIFHLLSAPLFCQILQNHAELCGAGRPQFPLPRGLSATINPSNGQATLDHAERKIGLHGSNDQIRQVCPLASGKLVIFGFNSVAYQINIVDLKRGELSDSFRAYDPLMSPDQRWIAYRDFFPPQSEVLFSEEYLLYDLEASGSGNRHSVSRATSDVAGWAMYPAFPGNAPFDFADIPEAKRHTWRSQSFFWVPDSRSVVFADSVRDRLSLVFVETRHANPQAYTYPVSAKAVCSQSAGVTQTLTLESASLHSSSTDSFRLEAIFADSGERPSCQPHPLSLKMKDFRPARLEVYPHRKLKTSKRVEDK